jgi:fibronectin type 3 domain-containing protein
MKYIAWLLILSSLAFGQVKAKVKAATTTTPASVSLTCTPPSTGPVATSFNFYRSTVSGAGYALLGSSGSCAYTDSTVAFSTTYYYVATSLDSSGESGYSNQATAVIPANPAPNPPTGLTVGTITAAVPLTWQAPSTPVYAYRVYRSTGGTFSLVASGLKTTTWTDHVPTGTYEYEIEAVYSNGKILSGPSNVQTITVE